MRPQRARLWWSGVIVLAGVLAGCDSTPPVAETPPPPVTVSQPVVREIVNYDEYEGRIGARAIQPAEVRARVRGHLTKVCFEDGQIVKEGALLFEIDPRPFEAALASAKAQLAAADAALAYAKSEYAREASLLRSNAASRQEAEVAFAKQGVAAADRLKAEAGVQQAQVDLSYTKITAPVGGKISRSELPVGGLVNAAGGETLLTTIVPLDPIYVYFDVDERALIAYQEHFRKQAGGNLDAPLKDLKIPVYVAREGEEGFPHEGVIDYADNKVNVNTGTKQVRGILKNSDRLFDLGMRARVRVPVTAPYKATLITERAIGTDQARRFVYVVNEEKIALRRDVKLGRLNDGLQVITDGLKPEEWLVVNGIQRVRDGAKVDPKQVPMPGAATDQATATIKK